MPDSLSGSVVWWTGTAIFLKVLRKLARTATEWCFNGKFHSPILLLLLLLLLMLLLLHYIILLALKNSNRMFNYNSCCFDFEGAQLNKQKNEGNAPGNLPKFIIHVPYMAEHDEAYK